MNKSTPLIRVLAASVTAVLLSFFSPPKSIYTVPFNDIDNQKVNLFQHKGKKMVFITLSGAEADSTLDQLSAFCLRYKDSTVIIGVLSIEDGYAEARKKAVKTLYKNKVEALILTEGMYTRKTSANQSPLMQWLTRKEQNMRVDQDVTEAGYKFFLDEDGLLYASLRAHFPCTAPIIQRIMSKPRRPVPSAANLEKRQNAIQPKKQSN